MSQLSNGAKKEYQAPEMIDLGTLAEQTKAGFGNTFDGSVEPPQATFPDPEVS